MKTLLPLLLLSLNATAQDIAAPAAPPVLGRLFATPEQRADLDQRRNNGLLGAAAKPAAPVAEAAAPPPPPPAPIELNGIVKRSGGQSTIWLNQVAQGVGNQNLPATRAGSPALKVNTPDGRHIEMKAGQRYDLGEGRVKEGDGR
jgi:hypothetical protein